MLPSGLMSTADRLLWATSVDRTSGARGEGRQTHNKIAFMSPGPDTIPKALEDVILSLTTQSSAGNPARPEGSGGRRRQSFHILDQRFGV